MEDCCGKQGCSVQFHCVCVQVGIGKIAAGNDNTLCLVFLKIRLEHNVYLFEMYAVFLDWSWLQVYILCVCMNVCGKLCGGFLKIFLLKFRLLASLFEGDEVVCLSPLFRSPLFHIFILCLWVAEEGEQCVPVVTTCTHLHLMVECFMVDLEVLCFNGPKVNLTSCHNNPDYRVIIKSQAPHCRFQLLSVVLASINRAFHYEGRQ